MFGKKDKDQDESTLKETAKKAAVVAGATKLMSSGDDDERQEESGGKGKLIALLLAGLAALGFFLKRKRERDLDEALWEDPRSL